MAPTREEMKEAVRAYDLGISGYGEYDKVTSEYIAAGGTWDELASLAESVRSEPAPREP